MAVLGTTLCIFSIIAKQTVKELLRFFFFLGSFWSSVDNQRNPRGSFRQRNPRLGFLASPLWFRGSRAAGTQGSTHRARAPSGFRSRSGRIVPGLAEGLLEAGCAAPEQGPCLPAAVHLRASGGPEKKRSLVNSVNLWDADSSRLGGYPVQFPQTKCWGEAVYCLRILTSQDEY